MGRFESPFQVLGLFLAASVVSVGVIFFVNAEAHNRLAASQNELPDSYTQETSDGDDVVGPLSLPLSSSKFVSSSELTQSSYATDSDSNYTSSRRSSIHSPSSPFQDGNGILDLANAAGTANVTLLNFLEDGLEKLLSLIKQAKNTYKSYYLYGGGKAVVVTTGRSSADMDVEENKKASNDDEVKGSNNNSSSSPSGTGARPHHPRRRKKREASAERDILVDAESLKIKNRSTISGEGARLRRAVISQNKRKKIGENEPYYWQMLEDNNSDNNHNHHYSHHHRDERSRAEGRDKSSSGGSSSRTHYSNSQYSPYYPHHYNHNQQQQNVNQPENHYFRSLPSSSSSSSSGLLAAGPGQAPAVASAFTGAADSSSGGGAALHSVHNPTSDFHKIRHAMNKLGGGGLDISVVERMILDTKSSGRSHSPASSRDQQQQHFNNRVGGGSGGRHLLSGINGARDEDSPSLPTSSLLTTAITKTTQGQQDEGGVQKLGQQQLAQSLLPPTVTWLGGGESTAVRYLPLPSSSLATGSKDDDDNENDSSDNDVDEDRRGNNGDNEGDDDTDNDGENSVSSTKRRKSGEGRKKMKKMMKRKKFEKAQRKNNELSYSPLPSSSSSSYPGENDDDEDYDQVRYGKGSNNKDNDNSDDSDNYSGNASYGDNTIVSGEDIEMDESRRRILDEEDVEEEEIIRRRNNSPPPPESQPSTPPHHSHNDGAKGHNGKDCYHTDDVLIVVAITCCLNFAFVLVIWALVRWFSISSNPKEKDFQNLGDCDDAMDPTIVFHGVNEDPCWTLAASAAASQSGAEGRGGGVSKDNGALPSAGMMTTRSGNIGGMGTHPGSGMLGANLLAATGGAGGGGGGMVGMLGSIHSVNKVDLFPTMGKLSMGGGDGRGSSSMGGTPVMTMTAERRLPYQSNPHIGTGGIIGLGSGSGGIMVSGIGANVYSFKPEHVPTHHGSSGTMHRSYSQSMEDLRYLQ